MKNPSSKMKKFKAFIKKNPLLIATIIMFTYTLIFKMNNSTNALEYFIGTMIITYALNLQFKHLLRQANESELIDLKIDYLLKTVEENKLKSGKWYTYLKEKKKLEDKLKKLQ